MADNPDPQRIRDAQNAQEDLNRSQAEYRDILYDTEATFDELYNAIKATADVVRSGNNEEAKRRTILKDSFSVLRNTLKNIRDLRDNEQGIVDLNDNQLKRKKELLESNLTQLETLADQLEKSYGLVDATEEQIKNSTVLTENEKELLLAKKAGFDAIKDSIYQTGEQIKAYERMNSALGLSGALLDNLERVGVRAFGGLGINLSAFKSGFTDALADAKEEAKKIAEEMKEAGKETANFNQKLAVIKSTGAGIKKALSEGLNDPLAFGAVAINALVKAFNRVQTASVEVSRLTGQTATGMATMQLRIASTADVLEVVSGLTKQIGFNANNAFSPETLAAAAEFKNTLGLSADEAGKLAILTQATGTNLDNNFESIVDSVNQFNRANRSAVSQGMVLRDVANVSDGISASLGGQAGAIAAASAAARRLGMELSNVDKIADTLMQFETSIGDELEAQLLTGRDINLAKARELALTNDLKGLGDELFKNSADLAEFSEMNRIQQQSLAQALGMSRDELARIAYLRAIETGMTEKQAAAAAQVNAEEMKRMTIQENFSKALEKVAQAFTPIIEGFALLASNSLIFYTTLGLIAGISLARTIGSLAAMAVKLGIISLEAITTNAALTFGLGAIAVGAAIVGLLALLGNAKKEVTAVEDAIIPPGKGRILSGPAGTISFDDRDTIVAGTNLGGGGGSNKEMLAKLDRLIAAVERGGNVYMDSNQVGRAMVLGSYKSS